MGTMESTTSKYAHLFRKNAEGEWGYWYWGSSEEVTSECWAIARKCMDDLVESAAQMAHDVNRAYCRSIGDVSQLPWEDAPEWQKDSARQGVLFHVENPDAGDAASHDNWCKQKLEDGWKYGPVKDPAKKEHPCLVPFNELPKEQQIKDALFRGTVHAAIYMMIAPSDP